jgi:hypothetical protein
MASQRRADSCIYASREIRPLLDFDCSIIQFEKLEAGATLEFELSAWENAEVAAAAANVQRGRARSSWLGIDYPSQSTSPSATAYRWSSHRHRPDP